MIPLEDIHPDFVGEVVLYNGQEMEWHDDKGIIPWYSGIISGIVHSVDFTGFEIIPIDKRIKEEKVQLDYRTGEMYCLPINFFLASYDNEELKNLMRYNHDPVNPDCIDSIVDKFPKLRRKFSKEKYKNHLFRLKRVQANEYRFV